MANDMTNVATIVQDQSAADKATEALRKEGYEATVLEGDSEAVMGELAERGFSDDDARSFAKATEKGQKLIAAVASKDKADEAIDIMERFEPSQDNRGGESGKTVPVVEEELSVEKGKVASGGVRATTTVEETPVEKSVNLQEEQVTAERKDADRALNADEAEAAFEEKTVEMMGTKEEAEVQKEARVVGEVTVNKEVSEREETVSDTVRKTDVEVEDVKANKGKRK